MTPALDEHVYYQNFHRYVKESGEVGIPMIYNLMCFHGDSHLHDAGDYAKLKTVLGQYVERTPRFKKQLSGKSV